MQKHLAAPEHIYDSPDPDDRRTLTEIYLASEVDARIAELEEQNRKMRHALSLIRENGFSLDDRRTASECLSLVTTS